MVHVNAFFRGVLRVCYVSLKTAKMCNCMVFDVTAIFFG